MKFEYGRAPNSKAPERWKVFKLQNLVRDAKNGFATGKRDNNGIVQIRMNNVTRDGHLIFDSYLKVPIPESIDEWLLREGDLLFNNTNSIDLVGKSAIFKEAPFPCTFSNHFTRIRFREDIVLPELILYHFIILWEKKFFRSVAIRHVGQAAVHTKYLFKLKITLPPLQEQQRIIEILSTLDNAIQKAEESITKTKRLKEGLMQELLTKGVILGFMLDTTVFNDILDKKIDTNKFPENFDYFVTHLQLDELNETPDPISREKLRQIFTDIGKEEIPTESFVLDVSRFDKAKFGYSEIFDELKKENLKHTEDALIGETAIMNGLILVTNDKGLLRKVRNLGGWAITVEDFLNSNYREFKDSEIGRIPRDWRLVELGEISDLKRGKFAHRPRNDPELYGGEFPFIQTGDIRQTDGIIREYSQTLNEEGFKVSELFKKGTIVISIAGNIGDVGILDFDSCFPDSIIGISANSKRVDNIFLMYLLLKYKHKLSSTAPRSTQKNINLRILNPFKLPLPSLPEQQKIAEILSIVDRKLNLEIRRKEKLERIKKGLMNDLLTGKKRVKI